MSGAPVTAQGGIQPGEPTPRNVTPLPRQATATALPVDIEDQLRGYLARHPSLSWDDALAQIIGGQNGRDVMG